jgi:hypothetical protein
MTILSVVGLIAVLGVSGLLVARSWERAERPAPADAQPEPDMASGEPVYEVISGVFEDFPEWGEHRGEEWRVLAWESEESECWSFQIGIGEPGGHCIASAEVIDDYFGGDQYLPRDNFGNERAVSVGRLWSEVAQAELQLSNGDVVPLHLVAPPEQAGSTASRWRYWIAFIPPTANGWIVTYGADGEELARRKLCPKEEGCSSSDVEPHRTLPRAGFIVSTEGMSVVVDMDGHVLDRLVDVLLAGNSGAAGTWLQHGRDYFRLGLDGGRVVVDPVPRRTARATMYEEGAEPDLAPPAGSEYRGEPMGHWRYTIAGPDGASLAQWSGECENPTAYWIDPDGSQHIITGETSLRGSPPASKILGWGANGDAFAWVGAGCGTALDPAGIYSFTAPGEMELVFETDSYASVEMYRADDLQR